MKKNVFVFCFLAAVVSSFGQKNEAMAYIDLGGSSLYGFNGGLSMFYTREMNSKFKLTGGLNFSTTNPALFKGLSADGTLHFPVKTYNVFLSNKLVYLNYGRSNFNEFIYRIAGTWESKYVDILIGNSFILATSKGYSYFEIFTPSVGLTVRLKPRLNPWNVSLFLRNYDDFLYENFNINAGVMGNWNINKQFGVFARFIAAPAGTLSQLSTSYKLYGNIGGSFKW